MMFDFRGAAFVMTAKNRKIDFSQGYFKLKIEGLDENVNNFRWNGKGLEHKWY